LTLRDVSKSRRLGHHPHLRHGAPGELLLETAAGHAGPGHRTDWPTFSAGPGGGRARDVSPAGQPPSRPLSSAPARSSRPRRRKFKPQLPNGSVFPSCRKRLRHNSPPRSQPPGLRRPRDALPGGHESRSRSAGGCMSYWLSRHSRCPRGRAWHCAPPPDYPELSFGDARPYSAAGH